MTKAAEPKTEFGSGQQKMNRASKLPEWVVEVLAMDSERGEVIRVTVTGDQPRVSQGQPIRIEMHAQLYATDPADDRELQQLNGEALTCLETAEHYLLMLGSVLEERTPPDPDPDVDPWSVEPAF